MKINEENRPCQYHSPPLNSRPLLPHYPSKNLFLNNTNPEQEFLKPNEKIEITNEYESDFLNFTRRTKGKALEERIDILSKQLEERIMKDLKKIEESIGEGTGTADKQDLLEYSLFSESFSDVKLKKIESFSHEKIWKSSEKKEKSREKEKSDEKMINEDNESYFQKKSIKKNNFNDKNNITKKIQENLLEIEKKAIELLKQKDYNSALDLLLQNEIIFLRFFHNLPEQKIYFCSLIAFCYLGLSKYNEVLIYSLKSSDLFSTFNEEIENKEILSEMLGLSGFCYFQLKEYKKAIKFFENAKLSTQNLQRKLELIFSLGMCFYKINDYNEALSCFSNLETFSESDPLKYILILLKSSEIYINIQNYDQSLSICKNLLLYLNNENVNDELLIEIYWKILNLYYQYENPENCLDLLEKIQEILIRNKENNDLIALIFYLKAQKTFLISDFKKTAEFYEKAKKIFEHKNSRFHNLYMDCIIKESECYFSARLFSKSIECYENCLKKMEEKQENLSHTGRIYMNIIYLSNLCGKKEKYEFYNSKLLNLLSEDYISFALYNELGNLYRNIKNYNEAIKMYEISIKIYEKNKEKSDKFLSNLPLVYYNLASCLNILNLYKESIKNLNLGLDLSKKINVKESNLNSKIYILLSEIYQKIGKPEESNFYKKKYKNVIINND